MESIETNEALPAQKQSFFENPKKVKGVFILLIILVVIFFLAAGTLGYLYWKKNDSFKKSNQENQKIVDQLKKDKADLEKQLTDVKKENEDLKKSNQQTSAEQANKLAIIKAYMEILDYFAQVVETHGGLTGWTEAEYQHAREIAKKTQSSSFLDTVDWAWNQSGVDPMVRIVRFLKEISSGVNDNLP